MSESSILERWDAPATASKLVFTAMGLVDTLTADQRGAALITDFSDTRRLDWDMIPKPDRTGVSLHLLDRHQKVLAWDLVRLCVPLKTLTKMLAITQLETVLRDYERELLGPALQAWRSPDSYFLTIFGRPGFEDTWTLRFLGHHVSMSVTVVQERWVFATPFALGAQPTEYDGVLKPLHDDEQLGFALLDALTDDQREQAIIHSVAPPDFVTRQVPHVGAVECADNYDLGMLQYRITDADRKATKFDRSHPRGISGDALSDEQAHLLRSLMLCYLERMPQETAAAHQSWLSALDPADVHFAWAGETARGRPHYFRIQTPSTLIEAVNAVNGGDHLHTVLRDLDHDLGHALLRHPSRDPSLTAATAHLMSRVTSTEPYDGPPARTQDGDDSPADREGSPT
ncbi:DUF3500 domain-containing protein [Williamsia sp. M5A3_1d]